MVAVTEFANVKNSLAAYIIVIIIVISIPQK